MKNRSLFLINIDEEKFCDRVAELVQFPEFYVNLVVKTISDVIGNSSEEEQNIGILINKLKALSKEHDHSLWGIYYRLRHSGILKDSIKIGGAAANLKKSFPTVREVLFSDPDPCSYVDMLFKLSPNFMNLVAEQIPNTSTRKFGEWVGLDTSIDASAVIQEITRRKSQDN
jgi:hypothetical protein